MPLSPVVALSCSAFYNGAEILKTIGPECAFLADSVDLRVGGRAVGSRWASPVTRPLQVGVDEEEATNDW